MSAWMSLTRPLSLCHSDTKFGQKYSKPVKVSELVSMRHVGNVSVHSACNLVLSKTGEEQCRLHVLWSQVGLQDKVGSRCQLFSTLGMFECANNQIWMVSHSPLARKCCAASHEPSPLTFLQLYTDSAHTHMAQQFKHPVSGVIATCGPMTHAQKGSYIHGSHGGHRGQDGEATFLPALFANRGTHMNWIKIEKIDWGKWKTWLGAKTVNYCRVWGNGD